MRLPGLLLSLGAIGWVLYTASGGSESEGVIPEHYQQSLQKAESVEQTLQQSAGDKLKPLEERDN